MTTSFVAGGHNYLAKSSRSIIEKKAYFWDEIRLRTASQLTGGCLYPIKVVLEFSEKIGRIQNAEPKLEGRGNYEFMLVPGVASSVEEWQREIDARHETAALRDAIAAIRATTGTVPTGSQIAALRETFAAACAMDTSPTPTRRPVNRIDKSSLKPDPALEQSKGEEGAPPQMPTVELALPSVPTVARTPTYRKVNRRQPAAPTTVPDA